MIDTEINTELQYALLETPNGGGGLDSDLWTLNMFRQSLTRGQQDLLQQTALRLTTGTLHLLANDTGAELPGDCLRVLRATWQTPGGVITEIPPAEQLEMDYSQPDWRFELEPTKPMGWTVIETPTLQIQIMPAVADAGLLTLHYVPMGPVLSNTGIPLHVPDECAPAVKWGALWRILSTVGRGGDPVRAAYAKRRFEEIIEAVSLLQRGWGR